MKLEWSWLAAIQGFLQIYYQKELRMTYQRPKDLQIELDSAREQLAKAKAEVKDWSQYIQGLEVADKIYRSENEKASP